MCTSGSSDNTQGPSAASTTASQGAPLAQGMTSSQPPETFNFQCSNVQPGTGRFFTDLISGQSRSHNMSLSGQYDVQPPYAGSSSMLESAASFSSGKKWIPNGKEGLTEVDARLLLPDYSCSSIIEEQGPGQNYLSENPRLHGNLLRYNSAPSTILSNSEAYREQDLHQGSRSLNESSQNSAILPSMFGTGLPPLPNPNASTSDRDHLSEYTKSYSGKQCEIGFSNQSSASTNVTAEHSLMGYGRNMDVSSGSFSGFRLASLNHQMNKAENLFGNPISKGNLMRHSSSPASLLSKLESEGQGLSGSSDDDLSDHDIGDMKLPGDVKLGGSGDGTHPLFKNLQNGGMSMRKRSRDDSPERQRNLMEHHTSPMLTRHMSLPGRTTVPLLAENLLQDSVPCRLRAKRGCATHPRSIAERVRRTRISERMRKLQELVPNMDKQTNTSDMLDEAIVYVKFLQQKVKELNDCRTKCQGLCKSDSNGGDQQ